MKRLKEKILSLIVNNRKKKFTIAWLAQLVERTTVNRDVTGSTPVPSVNKFDELIKLKKLLLTKLSY